MTSIKQLNEQIRMNNLLLNQTKSSSAKVEIHSTLLSKFKKFEVVFKQACDNHLKQSKVFA